MTSPKAGSTYEVAKEKPLGARAEWGRVVLRLPLFSLADPQDRLDIEVHLETGSARTLVEQLQGALLKLDQRER